MIGSPKKIFFDEIEMMTRQGSSVEASKMPRTADFDRWHAIHEYLRQFPYEGRWGC